jgi:hypothetical protein
VRISGGGVIHAQGARIRAQGAPGYVHKEQAHKRGGRLTGNFIPKRVILLPNPAVIERDLYLKLGVVLQRNLSSESGNSAPARFKFRFADGVKHVNLMTFTKHLNARF